MTSHCGEVGRFAIRAAVALMLTAAPAHSESQTSGLPLSVVEELRAMAVHEIAIERVARDLTVPLLADLSSRTRKALARRLVAQTHHYTFGSSGMIHWVPVAALVVATSTETTASREKITLQVEVILMQELVKERVATRCLASIEREPRLPVVRCANFNASRRPPTFL